MSETINVRSPDGTFRAHVDTSTNPNAPVVVVLHEVFGANADIRQTCEALAAQGFDAVAPDLFWRQQVGTDLSVSSQGDWKKGLALYAAYDRDEGVRDIIATVAAAATLRGRGTSKVGVMGYCLGGLMAFLTAARSQIDAAVAFHGGDTEKYLNEARLITSPLLMHLGDLDEFILPPAQAKIKMAFKGMPNVRIETYAGCHHAFSRHGGAQYDAAAAGLANDRTWSFLTANLG